MAIESSTTPPSTFGVSRAARKFVPDMPGDSARWPEDTGARRKYHGDPLANWQDRYARAQRRVDAEYATCETCGGLHPIDQSGGYTCPGA